MFFSHTMFCNDNGISIVLNYCLNFLYDNVIKWRLQELPSAQWQSKLWHHLCRLYFLSQWKGHLSWLSCWNGYPGSSSFLSTYWISFLRIWLWWLNEEVINTLDNVLQCDKKSVFMAPILRRIGWWTWHLIMLHLIWAVIFTHPSLDQDDDNPHTSSKITKWMKTA